MTKKRFTIFSPSFWFRPFQSLALGYFAIALAGAGLLSLPAASADGNSQPFIDAFFTSCSAVTTTGLTVVDTGTFYTLFGQIVIMALFQIGGLGYMIFFGLILYLLRGKPSLAGRMAFQESLVGITLSNSRQFIQRLILVTFTVELIGAGLLTCLWLDDFPFKEAVYQAAFHSISAFCTAGFSLFPDSISAWHDDPAVNAVLLPLMFLGAIGFFVIFDVAARFNRKKRLHNRLTLHSKTALITTAALLASGTLFLLISQPENFAMPPASSFLHSLFQATSAQSGAGFNTVDIGKLSDTGLLTLIFLMFVGSSPGSTGGGIKTTTLATIVTTTRAVLRNQRDVNVFGRRINREIMEKAITLSLLAATVIGFDVMILSATEKGPFLDLFFESASALATAGLSTGVTPALSAAGKIVISATMLVGRIGPLAVAMSLMGRREDPGYRYPEAEIFVG